MYPGKSWFIYNISHKYNDIIFYYYRVNMYIAVEEKTLDNVVPVKTEVKEEAVTVTKDELTSAQPTGMSSHFI